MKVLVTYISWTGNTRKVAEAIFQEIQGEKELRELKEVISLEDCRKACPGANLLGIFNCQGQLAQEELDKMMNNPDPQWQERAQNIARAKGLPDASSLMRVRAFVSEIMLKSKGGCHE